jgi:transcriptional regulator of nitric oxide reductase
MQDFYAAYRATGRDPDALRIAQLKARGTPTAAVAASFVIRATRMP